MATFKRAPMPRAAQFVNSDGSLTVPALNYLGNLEKALDLLTGLNGADDAFLAAARAAPSVSTAPVTASYSRAGATYSIAEITAALDEIQQVTLPALNARFDAIIASLRSANLMEA